jgi:hypothetical protein
MSIYELYILLLIIFIKNFMNTIQILTGIHIYNNSLGFLFVRL